MTFLIEPHEGIVRLTVTHENMPTGTMLSGISAGWPAVLANLVAELAQGDRQRERREPRHRQAETDLGRREPDDLGEEDGATGEEDAVAERGEHRLRRQSSYEGSRAGQPNDAIPELS